MASFVYSARDRSGKLFKGNYDAADKATVVSALKGKGLLPLEVKEKTALSQSIRIGALSKKVSVKDISVFCRQFATIIEAGIPVIECLDILRKQTESPVMVNIINKVYGQVQKGRSLSESLKEFKESLPAIMINMVEAGEASGSLDKVMNRLAVQFEKDNKIIGKAKSAMIYPAVIAVVTVAVIIILLMKVVPQFQTMFGNMGSDLPALTKLMISSSDFLKHNFLLLSILAIALIGGFIYYLRTENGRLAFDKLVLRIPIVSSMYRKLFAARFSRTLSSLLSAGLPLIQSIEITEKVVNNAVMSVYLQKVRDSVTKGTKLSVAVSSSNLFPPMINSMITIGEESGSLDSILEKSAEFYEEETETAIAGLVSLLEPIIIVVMAVVVGTIVLSIVQPMFGMFEAVQGM